MGEAVLNFTNQKQGNSSQRSIEYKIPKNPHEGSRWIIENYFAISKMIINQSLQKKIVGLVFNLNGLYREIMEILIFKSVFAEFWRKSNVLKVRAYCSASDHLIRKLFSAVCSRDSHWFEEYLKVSKSVIIFPNERSFFAFFTPLTCLDNISFGLPLFGPSRYDSTVTRIAPALFGPRRTLKISIYVYN